MKVECCSRGEIQNMTGKLKNVFLSLFTPVILLYVSFPTQTHAVQQNLNENGLSRSLYTKISVNLVHVPLEKALRVIAEKSKIKFNYVRKNIPLQREVSVSMENVPAIEALMKILNDTGTGLKITQSGLIAIIPAGKTPGHIGGFVTDENSGKPLVGANVIVRGTKLGAETDTNGRYLITKLSPGIYTLEASMIGYQKEQIENVKVSEGSEVNVRFQLREKSLSLSTTVVTSGHFSLFVD